MAFNKDYPMQVALLAAKNSRYEGTQVGCVISNQGMIISTGWNGNAPLFDDEFINSLPREEKLEFVLHAEENAILNAANLGISLQGCDAYITHYPCASCLSKLAKVGIINVYYLEILEAWCNHNIPKAADTSNIKLHKFVLG